MRIVIAGGSGFLGRPLASHLASKGHHVIVLARHPIDQVSTNLKFDTWIPDGRAEGEWVRYLQDANAVINLAGAGIADRRWTRSRKALLRGSRVLSTRSLVTAIRSLNRRPGVFLQGSAVGFYGSRDRTEDMLDESYPPGNDFLGTTCVDWETEARCVEPLGCRLVIVRTGIALAHDGGMIKRMIPPFKFFVGGPIGSGQQYISWVHRDDWVSLVTWALETPTISGIFNASAPQPATNADLAKAVGHALRRPSWLRVPKVAVRAVVGELAQEGLIRGQRVVPKRALDYGFMFKYENVDDAVRAIAEQL